MTKFYLLSLVVALFLMEMSWAQSAASRQLYQVMQHRDDSFKNKKIVWDTKISEEYSEEFLKEMGASLDLLQRNLSQKPPRGAVNAHKIDALNYSDKRVICKGENIIRINYSYRILNFSNKNEENTILVKRGIAYFGKGVAVYLPDMNASQKALGTTNIAYVVRYTRHAAYYLAPILIGGRDFQPPDLVMLCGMNPLMMYWGEPNGWTVVQEDNRFLVIEKRGTVPCLPADDPLRVRVWLDKEHGFAPYRIEKYTDDPRVLENYRVAAREVWQANQYMIFNGLYYVSQFNYTYYIKGHLVDGKLVYSGKRQFTYKISDIDKYKIDNIDIPDYVSIADFSLNGRDPIVGTLDRAVTYSWRQYRRLLNNNELKKLFQEQFPEPDKKRPNLFRTILTYIPPILIIVIGLLWFWKTYRR